MFTFQYERQVILELWWKTCKTNCHTDIKKSGKQLQYSNLYFIRLKFPKLQASTWIPLT